jgi:hypothetical protein
MSLFKAALTGFSAAGANVANKYLDEQIAKDRAQFMADLQRKTSGQIREDDFAFKTDPGRVQTTRDIAAGDVAARATATRDAEKAGWSDTEYQRGKDAQAEKDMQADAKRMSLLERARVRTGGGGGGDNDPFSKLPPAVRAAYQGLSKQAEQINSAIVKAQADGTWNPDDKQNKSQGELLVRLRVLEDRAQDLLKPYIPKQKGAASDDEIKSMMTAGPAAPTTAGAAPAGANKPPSISTAGPSSPEEQPAAAAQGPGIWDRVKQAAQPVTNALSPSLDAHAQRALALGDKGAMRELLAQTNSPKPLSPAVRAKLEAALKS